MSKYCPIMNRQVVYLDCQDCDDKECLKEREKIKDDASRQLICGTRRKSEASEKSAYAGLYELT